MGENDRIMKCDDYKINYDELYIVREFYRCKLKYLGRDSKYRAYVGMSYCAGILSNPNNILPTFTVRDKVIGASYDT